MIVHDQRVYLKMLYEIQSVTRLIENGTPGLDWHEQKGEGFHKLVMVNEQRNEIEENETGT